jgi:hypothetical protein
VLAAALLLWPFAGLSWIPWLIGLGALVVLRVLRLDGPLRGWDLPLAGLVVVIGLMVSTGPWAWALAASIGVLLAGLAQLPWWRLAAVGAVMCVVSGVGYAVAAHQTALDAEQAMAQANVRTQASVAERSEEILPAFFRALEQPATDWEPICRLLGPGATAQLVAATARTSCAEAVDVLHSRWERLPPGARREQLPRPEQVPGTTSLVVDGCSTRWARAAGPNLGRLVLGQVSADQQTYEVASFSAC